ncbi:hypothetical protein RBK84_00445, partial [Pseudomonas aeruginosa]|uniref:hypothetical protein n=1 Tax=Pseudomonas aeruginosa TaxID=287 RepID=UPI0027D3F0DB
SSPPFTDITLSSLFATTPGAKESTPPPVDTSLVAEATPGQLSQPGSQSEKIAAMIDIDDPVTSPEAGGGSDAGGGDKTPETGIPLVGTGSSTRRRKKLVVSKNQKPASSETEEGSEGKKSHPEKLPTRSSDSSKGGKKK